MAVTKAGPGASPPEGGSAARFVVLALGAAVLPNALWFWRNDCFRGRLVSRFSPPPPPTPEAPFGVTCDYFPHGWDLLWGHVAYAVIFLGLGYLASVWVRMRPWQSAALLGVIGTTAGMALSLFAYPDALSFDVTPGDDDAERLVRSIRFGYAMNWLIGCAVAAAISLLGAAAAAFLQRRANRLTGE